jgi:hypothetical protein
VKQRVTSNRRPKFCWAGNDAITAIQEAFEGRELNTALGIYQGLTHLASGQHDGEHNGFEASRGEIYQACGVSGRTFDEYSKRFKMMQLLAVEEGGGSHKNTWILSCPPATTAGGQLLRGGSDCGETPRSGDGGSLHTVKKNQEPSVVGDQRSPTTSGPAIKETATRFCRFLTEAGGGDPDEKRYSAKQLTDATFLLERRDRELLKSVVEWAHTRTYWAPKVVSSTTLRRWWDQLFADYRAARRQGAGTGLQADRSDVPEIPGVHPGVVASAVFMLKGAGEPVTEERIRERLRRSGQLPDDLKEAA